MEEVLAVVWARGACLLAAAVMVRLIRAFPAIPSPAMPAQLPAGLAGLGMRRQCPGAAGKAGA